MNESARLNRALDRLQKTAASSATYGSRVSAENEYGSAYRELVRQGAKPQLRARYRRQGGKA